MKIAIMQPYFLPYIGYWQLIKAVDIYVIYDDVAYIKGGWINRNNFLMNGEKRLFTVKLKNASSNKLINEVEILDDFKDFTKMLQANYAKAPYFRPVMKLVDKIIVFDKMCLSSFIINSVINILHYLDIRTDVRISSSLAKDNSLKGKDKVIAICKLLSASDYYNAIGGIELYDREEFYCNGINLSFLKTNISPYKQFKNDFVSALSILDIMMFNPPEKINEMLDNYELI
jgi:hypothetical protein